MKSEFETGPMTTLTSSAAPFKQKRFKKIFKTLKISVVLHTETPSLFSVLWVADKARFRQLKCNFIGTGISYLS